MSASVPSGAHDGVGTHEWRLHEGGVRSLSASEKISTPGEAGSALGRASLAWKRLRLSPPPVHTGLAGALAIAALSTERRRRTGGGDVRMRSMVVAPAGSELPARLAGMVSERWLKRSIEQEELAHCLQRRVVFTRNPNEDSTGQTPQDSAEPDWLARLASWPLKEALSPVASASWHLVDCPEEAVAEQPELAEVWWLLPSTPCPECGVAERDASRHAVASASRASKAAQRNS